MVLLRCKGLFGVRLLLIDSLKAIINYELQTCAFKEEMDYQDCVKVTQEEYD